MVGVNREDRSEIEEGSVGHNPLGFEGMMAAVWTSPRSAIVKAQASHGGVSDRGGWSHRQARCCLPVKSQEKTELPPFPIPRGPNSRSRLCGPCRASFCEQKSDHMLPGVRYVTRLGALCKISPMMKITFSCCI